MKFLFIFALFLSGKFTLLFRFSNQSFFSANAAVIEEESERQMDTVMVPPNDDFEESVREESEDNAEDEIMKAR